jgi:glycosyltransferase involved in cell wall biosynthesis
MISRPEPSQAAPIRAAVYLADQNPHRDRSLGITSMTRSLLNELSTRPEVELSLISSRSSFQGGYDQAKGMRFPFRTDRMVGRLICDTMHPLLMRPQCDLWYYPKGYLSLLMRPSSLVVGTMHDAIIQHYADHYPESRTSKAFKYWLQVMKSSLRRLDLVLTVSEHAKGQLEAFCDRHGISAPPIEVTYESSWWEIHRDQRWPKNETVVHLASAHPHKKTNHLLSMWQQLQAQSSELPRLQLIGRLDDEGMKILAGLRNTELVAPLNDEALVTAIGQARAVIISSEIEGFGLPALEAYYVGTPACYVRGTSVEEVVTQAGQFGAFELDDATSLHNALTKTLDQSTATIDAISQELYQRFSNERFADRVISSFARLKGNSTISR